MTKKGGDINIIGLFMQNEQRTNKMLHINVINHVMNKASTCQEISWQKEILGSGRKNARKSFLEGN
jgi:hypothetical protein